MADDGQLLDAVGAVYAAALDSSAWPEAFRRIASLFDAVGCTLEIIEKDPTRLVGFWSEGVVEIGEVPYAQEYLKRNPRVPDGFGQRVGEVGYDYRHMDEEAIRADPFYQEFLPMLGLRYYISCTLLQGPFFAALAVHRQADKNHVEATDIRLMERLAPHLRQAFDLGRRLGALGRESQVAHGVLDWLAEGVVLLGPDGIVRFANAAAIEIAGRNDGIRIVRDRLEFASPAARALFEKALHATVTLAGGTSEAPAPARDLPVARPDDLPPYILALRPVAAGVAARQAVTESVAVMVFIHDPVVRRRGTIAHAARQLYGLTEAEAHFAEALQNGATPQAYAHEKGVSLNTVYTHLRRLKAKTGHHRIAGLTAHLATLRGAAREG